LWAKAEIFWQKPAAKMKKKYIFLYLLNAKTEFVLSAEIKCPKCGIFTINYWVHGGKSGKVILQVSIVVFFGRCRKIFRAKMAQPP